MAVQQAATLALRKKHYHLSLPPHFAMVGSWPLAKLLHSLSEESYDRTFVAYRYWIGLGATRGGVSNLQIYNDVRDNTKPDLIKVPWLRQVYINYSHQDVPTGELIHTNVHLLLRFITDAEQDPALSTYATGLHDRLCRESLEQFFMQVLDYISGSTSTQLCEFYTRVNLIAHWINLGYVKLEDIRDHILQPLILQPVVCAHHLNSLMILLKISGATLAAYVDPSIIDRCCVLLKSSKPINGTILSELAEVRMLVLRMKMGYECLRLQEILQLRENDWKGLPLPPALRSAGPKGTALGSQDPAATPVAASLGLPDMGEQSQPPILSSPTPEIPSKGSSESSAPPSPTTSITALSDFTIADSLDDEPALEPETITLHDMFYLDDGGVEVLCGKTLFRVHPGTLSFHSPALRQMVSPANLAAAESPNGCPRIVSSDTPADFVTLLKIIYLPE